MAELNVALILRLVDRLTAPARRITRVVEAIGVAQTQVAKATKTFTASAQMATKATTGLSAAVNVATASFDGAAQAARVAGQSAEDLGRSEDSAARAADLAARRFGMLEKAQMRGRAAMRMMGGEIDKLDKQLGRLAMASLAVEGVAPAAHALSHLVGHSVGEAASFSGGMTGFGITAEMTDRQMAPIRAAILEASRRYALDPETALETFAFTRRSGVFRDPTSIITAGNEAARFQKLAERMKSPVTGEEVAGGASSFVREYGFAATPDALRRAFAMVDAAEKTGGGMTISDLLQYARSSGGQMKALGAGDPSALADVLAGEQLSMFLAHTGGQAGINFQDLLTQLAQTHTLRRYQKHGVNLEQVIKDAEAQGISPVETIARVTQMMTGGDRFRIGELMINQQATQSMLALIQNMDKFRAYRNAIKAPSAVPQYNADVSRATSGPAASFERYRVAQQRIAIAMGTILLPIASRLADVLEKIASAMSAVGEKGGFIGRAAVFALAGFTALLVGTVALGHALIAIAAPLITIRFLTGKALPLSLTILRGQFARLASGGLTVARTALAGLGVNLSALATGGLPAAMAAMSAFSATVVANTVALLANPATWIFLAIAAAVAVAAVVIRKYWQPITVWMAGAWSGFLEGLQPLTQGVQRAFSQIGGYLAPLKPIWAWLAGAVSSVWRWFVKLVEPVKMTGDQLRGATASGHAFGLMVGRIVTDAVRIVGRLGQLMFGAGVDVVGGLVRGLVSGVPILIRTVANLGGAMAAAIKQRLGIHSPSRVFAELGRQTIAGLDVGMASGAGGAALRASRIAVGVATAAALGLSGPGGALANIHDQAQGARAGSASPSAAQRRPVTITNHFHIVAPTKGDQVDHRRLAREMHDMQRRSHDAALHDGGDDL